MCDSNVMSTNAPRPHISAPTRRVRRLKEPRPVRVRTDDRGNPVAIANLTPRPPSFDSAQDRLRPTERGSQEPATNPSGGSAAAISRPHPETPSRNVMSTFSSVDWTNVSFLRRPWRIDQLWWRPGEAVSRRYFRMAAEDGPPFTLYQDLLTGDWYRQEY